MASLGRFVLTLVVTVIELLAKGLVLSKLWGWFIAGTFHIRAISYLEAVGISMTIGFLFVELHMAVMKAQPKQDDELEKWYPLMKGLIMTLVVCPIVLGMGALWHLVMN